MSTILDLYRVAGTAGNVGTPGAPILHFDLLVHAASGRVSGQATITQAVQGPASEIHIRNVTGQVRKLGFGTHNPITQVVMLEGTYTQAGPPPTTYVIQEQFRAHFATDSHWDGRGAFDYGQHAVENVPVKNEAQSGSHPIPLYGVGIHEAIAGGDLAKMKSVAAQAEAHIAKTPEIESALKALKAEIAKAGG